MTNLNKLSDNTWVIQLEASSHPTGWQDMGEYPSKREAIEDLKSYREQDERDNFWNGRKFRVVKRTTTVEEET